MSADMFYGIIIGMAVTAIGASLLIRCLLGPPVKGRIGK